MARAAKPTDFVLTVDGVGTFTFGRRTFRDEIAAGVEFARLTEGQADLVDDDLRIYCSAMADLKVLTVDAPAGWNAAELDDLDPFDEVTYANVLRVWGALRDKERSFRPGHAKGGQAGGEGPGLDGGVVVPGSVQAGPDGP